MARQIKVGFCKLKSLEITVTDGKPYTRAAGNSLSNISEKKKEPSDDHFKALQMAASLL